MNYEHNNSNTFYNNRINSFNKSDISDVQMSQSSDNKKGNMDPKLHEMNIERRLMERGNMFNMDTQYKNKSMSDDSSYGRYKEESKIGEITGEMFDSSQLDQGMPIRYFLNEQNKEDIQTEDHDIYNPKLDFDLYDTRPNINVSYYDPHQLANNPRTNFSDINNNSHLLPPIDRIKPEIKFSSIINAFSWNILNKLKKVLKNNTLILSPLSILCPFTILYRGSKDKTEEELKYFFSLPNKKIAFQSLNTIMKKLHNTYYTTISNFVLIPSTFPLNKTFVNYVNNIGHIDQINLMKPTQEINRINSIIKNMSKNMIKDVISSDVLNINTCLILINAIYFCSYWKYSFDIKATKLKIFYGIKKRKILMMHMSDKKFRYFEDNINKIIELDYADNDFSMGFIISKNNSELLLDNEQYKYYISQLHLTYVKNLQIPKMTHQQKLKIDNIFRRSNMKELFTNANLSDITPSNNILHISDVIHKIVIIINEQGSHSTKTSGQKNPSGRYVNFIADHPFIFYVRYIPMDVILFIGQYN